MTSGTRRVGISALVLIGYAAVSFLYFGWRLLPHPGRFLVGAPGERDPEIFIWSFAWWPHAIGQLTNPFITHVIYAPTGINLAWTTSVPGLALLFAPLTLLFGPDVSYNVAALLLPALAAWTAYLLCRHLTGSLWASLIGGYLFGFSSYMLGHQLAGHLNLTGVFLVPLIALALVRYANGELGGRGLAWRLGVMLALQLSISTEVALTLTLMLALGLLIAYACLPGARHRLLTSLPAIAVGYGLAAVLASPLLYYVLQGYSSGTYADPSFFDADLLNLVLPTRVIGLGGDSLASISSHFPGNLNEQGFYLGLPVLVVVALYALRMRRSAGARFLCTALTVTIVLALGTSLHVDGRSLVTLPWTQAATQPLLDNVLPARFALYGWLAAAVIVALWIESTAGRIFRRPYILPVLAVAALVPAFWRADFVQEPERWPFFSDGLYRACVAKNETLAVFPFGRWGDSLLWQAESNFWFRIAEGNMGRSDNYPSNFVADPTVAELTFQFTNPAIRPTMAQLIVYAERHHVDRVVSAVVHAYPDGTMMHSFGGVQDIGEVLIAPACGYTLVAGNPVVGKPGNELVGQREFGVHAAYTVILDSVRMLARAHALLGTTRGLRPAASILALLAPVLQQLQIDDHTAPDLIRAVRLAGEAESLLARSATERARTARLIQLTKVALRRYADTINSGIVDSVIRTQGKA